MAMAIQLAHEFRSLMDCLDHIARTFAGDVTIRAKDRVTGDDLGVTTAPAFLIRGESRRYSTTTATMQRVPMDQNLSDRAGALLPGLTGYIESQLRDFLKLSKMDSAGFAQHYGLPTELLDLTASPRVAGFFASGEEPGTQGVIGLFPIEQLSRFAVLIDLRNHDKAYRPRRQQAFAVFHSQHTDLKASACVEQLESQWFGFTLKSEDKIHFQSDSELLDAHTDAVAGALQLVIDSMVLEHGKLPDEVARWLSKRVAVAPFVTRPYKYDARGNPVEVELVSALSANMKFDEASEREKSYRFWSSRYDRRSRDDA